MRILSLLPSATEIVYALGLEDQLVGVTEECDHPPAARGKPSVSGPVVPAGTPAEIDSAVRARVAAGLPLYDLDIDLVRSLRPDLVLAQDLCRVCAVPSGDVTEALALIGPNCEVLSLDPRDLAGVLETVRQVATAAGAGAAGEALFAELTARLDVVTSVAADRTAPARRRPLGAAPAQAGVPRVVCLEWADPPFVGGNWVPDMVRVAGGEPLLGIAGEPSRRMDWADVEGAAADVAVFMPCGYDLAGAVEIAAPVVSRLAGSGSTTVWAVDATSYFSRPGPRTVDGVELLAAILGPGAPEPAPRGSAVRLA